MKNLLFNQMRKYRLNSIALVPLSLGLNIISSTMIWAKPITYDFTVNVVKGSLKGNTYQGFFSYDDEELIGKGKETVNVQQGLKVCMNFFNQMYSESNDVDYPQYPLLILKDGKPETLDFWMESPQRRIWWNRDGWEVEISQRENSTLISDCSN